jgi:hypothetical protein
MGNLVGENTGGPPAILGTGTDGSAGVVGGSDSGAGVSGLSTEGGVGVSGNSNTGPGVTGLSQIDTGVKGESGSSHGVYGRNAEGSGIQPQFGCGVWGESANGYGVFGASKTASGVYGTSGPGNLAGEFVGDHKITGNASLHGNHTVIGNVRITGDHTVTGNVTAADMMLSGADCAEEFDLLHAREIEPGSVVVFNEGGSLSTSDRPYNKRVAGVVSGAGTFRPGVILDRRASDRARAPIALVGKVYCRVDAAYGPIEVGDLLTTSATVGCAMKAQDPLRAFGAIIGKALGSIDQGCGLIPILVALG